MIKKIILILVIFCIGYKIGTIRAGDPVSISAHVKSLFAPEKEINLINEETELVNLTMLMSDKKRRTFEKKIGDELNTSKRWHSTIIEPNKYEKVKFIINEDTLKGKVKLKGNTLQSVEFPNLRIKLKSGKNFFDMDKFSIHLPYVKGYESEWFFHEFTSKFDLFPLKYGFINFGINSDGKRNLYAYEEHFTSQLINNAGFGDGVIICYDESDEILWYNHNVEENDQLRKDAYFIADIKMYEKADNLKDTAHKNMFLKAAQLLSDFRKGKLKVEDVFDVDKASTFFVICDLFGSAHALESRNAKFFYNSNTNLLEFIPYDLHGVMGEITPQDEYFNKGGMIGERYTDLPMTNSFLSDSAFQRSYLEKVKYFSELNLDVLFEKEIMELDKIQYLCSKYDTAHKGMNCMKVINSNKAYLKRKLAPFKISNSYFDTENKKLKIINILDLPIEVIGFCKEENKSNIESISPVFIYGVKNGKLPKEVILDHDIKDNDLICVRVLTSDTIYFEKINRYYIK